MQSWIDRKKAEKADGKIIQNSRKTSPFAVK
jgi:hypothetical protein